MRRTVLTCCCLVGISIGIHPPPGAQAQTQPTLGTLLEFESSMGNFYVYLYDDLLPETVGIFMDHVRNGDYQDTVINRISHQHYGPAFIEGGVSTYHGEPEVYPDSRYPFIPTRTVEETANLENRMGTIAMGRQYSRYGVKARAWVINLFDNMDTMDGRQAVDETWTVFGEVYDGMETLYRINNFDWYNYFSPMTRMPLANFTEDQFNEYEPVDHNHVVRIWNINVLATPEYPWYGPQRLQSYSFEEFVPNPPDPVFQIDSDWPIFDGFGF